ncbi:hypothetical protein B296_00012555 [Ensete ventricosum]|uniref:Uncharacterized protein n=1 Tax=Ensete ventricosum TaxID=4639 RepID=A0A427AZX8_ENSVE|nr:hypothetical protein B296_00012555 [Ensete ventricosum]
MEGREEGCVFFFVTVNLNPELFLVTNEICRLLNNLAKGAPETLLDTVHSQEKQRSSPLPWGKMTCILFLLALTLFLLLLPLPRLLRF